MNIYITAINAVLKGSPFVIDFEERTLKVDDHILINSALPEDKLGVGLSTKEDFINTIEILYSQYRRSIPSERSENKKRRYFIPLPESELSNEDMMYGEEREVAQLRLELYILCQLVLGFPINELFPKRWFWRSDTYSSLVLLKTWFN